MPRKHKRTPKGGNVIRLAPALRAAIPGAVGVTTYNC